MVSIIKVERSQSVYMFPFTWKWLDVIIVDYLSFHYGIESVDN